MTPLTEYKYLFGYDHTYSEYSGLKCNWHKLDSLNCQEQSCASLDPIFGWWLASPVGKELPRLCYLQWRGDSGLVHVSCPVLWNVMRWIIAFSSNFSTVRFSKCVIEMDPNMVSLLNSIHFTNRSMSKVLCNAALYLIIHPIQKLTSKSN